MRTLTKTMIFVFVSAMVFTSCVSKKKFTELMSDKEATAKMLSDQQQKVSELEGNLSSLQTEFDNEKTKLNNELSSVREDLESSKSDLQKTKSMVSAKEAEIAEMKSTVAAVLEPYQADGLGLTEKGGRAYLSIEPITFASGSARLSKDERSRLESLAEALKANPKVMLDVEGNTDDKKVLPDAGYDNWDLSMRRAKAVVAYLIKQGVAATQLSPVGRGETMPIADNETEEGRAANRRVEFAPDPALAPLMMKN